VRSGTSRDPVAVGAVVLGAVILAIPVLLGIGSGLVVTGFEDLAVYQAAVEVWVSGESPYGRTYVDDLLFVYPPSSLVAVAPLALLPTPVAGTALVLVGAALTVALVRMCHPALPSRWLLAVTGGYLMTEPWLLTFNNGQVSVLLVALAFVAVLRGSRSSGWLLGVATAIKVYPAAYALVDVVRGRARALGGLVAAVVALTVLALAGVPGLVGDWLAQQREIGADPVRDEDRALNQSWRGLLEGRIGDSDLVWVAVAATIAIVAVAATVLAVRRGDLVAALAAVSLGIVLAAPVVWTHYWVFLPAVVATVRRSRDPVEVVHGVAVLALLASAALYVPLRFPGSLTGYALVVLGSFVLLTLAAALARRARGGVTTSAEATA
jgi:alpha-1,2-mannosyltransferase